ncbi:MAG: tyrosine-type recombinase/integrase [bacterium]
MDDYSARIWETEKNGILYALFRLNGKLKWVKIGEKRFLSREVINKKKKEIMEKLARGEYIDKKIYFEKMAEEFLNYTKENRTERTHETIIGHIKKHLRYFRGYLLTKINLALIEGYVEHRRRENPELSDKTVINELFTLSAVFKRAIRLGYLKENPVKNLEMPKYTRPEMKCFTPKEMELIFANCSKYLRPILMLGITTGLRHSEICNIKWDNVDLEAGIIKIVCDETFKTKNKKNKLAIIVPQLRGELEYLKECWVDYMNDNIMPRQPHQMVYVFCHNNGRPIKSFAQSFEKLMKKLCIEKASPHTMRHTFITYHERFGDPYLTQKMAGHSDQRQTQGYYHVQLERMKESMEPIKTLINSCVIVRQSLENTPTPTVYSLEKVNQESPNNSILSS